MELVLCLLDTETNAIAAFKVFFNYFEIFVIAVFTVEYVLRIFTIDKIKNIFKPFMMVDLLTILPVTGLIFVAVLCCSSLFMCFAEQSTAHLMLKKWPPSSLWSIVAFGIYTIDGDLPLKALYTFINSITPGCGMIFQGLAVCVVCGVVLEIVMKKYNAFLLKKSTIRQEPSFVDF